MITEKTVSVRMDLHPSTGTIRVLCMGLQLNRDVSPCTNQRPFRTRTHLFVVHIGEINAIHFHYLISNLDFKEKILKKEHNGAQSLWYRELDGGIQLISSVHLESNFSRQRSWFDVADVDARLLGWTTADADSNTHGAHQAEKNLLLLDFFASNGCQAGNAALFFLCHRVTEKHAK